MIILAIDPGIGKTGVCVYSTHILQVDLTKGELPAIPDNFLSEKIRVVER